MPTKVATPVLGPDRPAPEPKGIGLEQLRALVELYYDAQKFRVRGTLRVSALKRGAMAAERLKLAVEKLKEMEDGLAKGVAQAVKHEPVAPWLMSLHGIGPMMTAGLIASGLDPKIDKPSSWWRFAGVGVVDGKNQRLRRGQKRSYNGFLRRTLYVMLGGFLKAHGKGKPSFYATLYYDLRAKSERERPHLSVIDCPGVGKGKGPSGTLSFPGGGPGPKVPCLGDDCTRCGGEGTVPSSLHHHARAAMLVQRIFLTHLMIKWREALGLPPPRNLWVVEKYPEDGVHQVIDPPDGG